MTECAKCRYWVVRGSSPSVGNCTITLPPWLPVQTVRHTRDSQGCDLGKEKEQWDEFRPR